MAASFSSPTAEVEGKAPISMERRRSDLNSQIGSTSAAAVMPPSQLEETDTDEQKSTNLARSRRRRRQDMDIEQKREASRTSSRRSQKRQKTRIEYLAKEETRITQANLKQKEENDTLRIVIQHIRTMRTNQISLGSQSDPPRRATTNLCFSTSTTANSRGGRVVPDVLALQSSGNDRRLSRGLASRSAGNSQHPVRVANYGLRDTTSQNRLHYLGRTGRAVIDTSATKGALPARGTSFLSSSSSLFPMGSEPSSNKKKSTLGLVSHPAQQEQLPVEEAIRQSRTSLASTTPPYVAGAQTLRDIITRTHNNNNQMTLSSLRGRITSSIGRRSRYPLSSEPFQIANHVLLQHSQDQLLGPGPLLAARMRQHAAQLVADSMSQMDLSTLLRGRQHSLLSLPVSQQEALIRLSNLEALLASRSLPAYNVSLPSDLSTASHSNASSPHLAIFFLQQEELRRRREFPTTRTTASYSHTVTLDEEHSTAHISNRSSPSAASSSTTDKKASTQRGKSRKDDC
jgi:hypothetical protein